jgi:hypothetical protein
VVFPANFANFNEFLGDFYGQTGKTVEFLLDITPWHKPPNQRPP